MGVGWAHRCHLFGSFEQHSEVYLVSKAGAILSGAYGLK